MRTDTSQSVSMISVFQKDSKIYRVKSVPFLFPLIYNFHVLIVCIFLCLFLLVYFILQIFVSPSYLYSYSSRVVFSIFPYLCFNVQCLSYLSVTLPLPCLLSSFLPSLFHHVLISYFSGLSHIAR